MDCLVTTQVAARLDAQERRFARTIAWGRGLPPSRVAFYAYRDLSSSPACAARRIFAFLGVGGPLSVAVNATLKMGSSTPRGDLANADEVALALRGGRWDGEVDLPG